MYWQREVLRSGTAMTFNETWEMDLPKKGGILGSLALYLRSTTNADPFATAVKWRLIDYISKIEVIPDGGDPIKSFDGRQALASCYYDQGQIPTSQWRYYTNTPNRQWIILNFGRKLLDELYALNLSRYENVKLKITNDATSTQFTTSVQLDVIAYWMREPTSAPIGHFKEEEWVSIDPVADAWNYQDLPTGLPIRRVLLRNRPGVDSADAKNNSSMFRLMDDINFRFKSGQSVVYRGSLEQLAHLGFLEDGFQPMTWTNIDRTDEYGYEVGVGYVTGGVGAGMSSSATPSATSTMGAADVNDSAQEIQQRVADQPLQGFWRGVGFMHNVPIFVARRPDLSDLLDPEAQKVVKLDTHCASGATVSGTAAAAKSGIILSRLVR